MGANGVALVYLVLRCGAVQVSNTADLQRWGLCIVDRSRVRLQDIMDSGLG